MRKGRRKKERRTGTLSPEVLARQGLAHLEAGRFREAVQCLKPLVEAAPGQGFEARLAEAYMGRAKECAAKSMYREALLLLDDAGALSGSEPSLALRLAWLVNAHRLDQAAARFFADEARVRAEDADFGERLAAGLALAVVAGRNGILAAAPADSLFRREGEAALAAIAAAAAGDDAALSAALGGLSLRGPFRALRLFLKAFALSAGDGDGDGAGGLLARIPPESPFAPVAAVLAGGLGRGGPTVASLSRLDAAGRGFVAAMLGVGPEILRQIERWNAAGDKGCRQMEILGQLQAQTGTREPLRRFGLELLALHPQCRGVYERVFGRPHPTEGMRVTALEWERKGQIEAALQSWQALLGQPVEGIVSGDPAMVRALVLRRMAELERTLNGDASAEYGRYLEQSLTHDQDDRGTHLALIAHFGKRNEASARFLWVERALTRFPEDLDVLGAALEAALERKTFKKASGLAARILEKDPINIKVRGQIVAAHLSHARKSSATGRLDLARREIARARDFERPGSRTGLVDIAAGMVELLSGNEAEGMTLIQKGWDSRPGVMEGGLAVLLEAHRMDLAEDRRAALARSYQTACGSATPRGEDLLALLSTLEGVSEQEGALVFDLMAGAEPYLRKATALPLASEPLQRICATFREFGLYSLLEAFAKAGERQWPEEEAFTFFRILGRRHENLDRLSANERRRLDEIAERAGDRGRFDLADDIDEFLLPPFDLPAGIDPLSLLEGLFGSFDDTENVEEAIGAIERIVGSRLDGEPFKARRPGKGRKRRKSGDGPGQMEMF